MQNNSNSFEEIISKGEKLYFDKQSELEKAHLNEFAVIEVESEDIVINEDKLSAVTEARKKHPNSMFYIVQIGKLKKVSNSAANEVRKYCWAF
jgi:hypothetical protein